MPIHQRNVAKSNHTRIMSWWSQNTRNSTNSDQMNLTWSLLLGLQYLSCSQKLITTISNKIQDQPKFSFWLEKGKRLRKNIKCFCHTAHELIFDDITIWTKKGHDAIGCTGPCIVGVIKPTTIISILSLFCLRSVIEHTTRNTTAF